MALWSHFAKVGYDDGARRHRRREWFPARRAGQASTPADQGEWGVNLQRQCEAAEVHFFFKQWGGTNKGWFKVSRTDGKRDHHLARRGATKGGYWNEVSDRGVTKYGRMRGSRSSLSLGGGERGGGLRRVMAPRHNAAEARYFVPPYKGRAAVAGADLGWRCRGWRRGVRVVSQSCYYIEVVGMSYL